MEKVFMKVKSSDGIIMKMLIENLKAMKTIKESFEDVKLDPEHTITLAVSAEILNLIHNNYVFHMHLPLKYIPVCASLGYVPLRTILKPITDVEIEELTLEEVLNILLLQIQLNEPAYKHSILCNLKIISEIVSHTQLFMEELFDLFFENCKEPLTLNFCCVYKNFVCDMGENVVDASKNIFIDPNHEKFVRIASLYGYHSCAWTPYGDVDKNHLTFTLLKTNLTKSGKKLMVKYYCNAVNNCHNHFENMGCSEMFASVEKFVMAIKMRKDFDKLKFLVLRCCKE